MNAGDRLGPYEILAPLGIEGIGEVYRARDTRLDRIVSLKILPGALTTDREARERFDRDARAMAAVDHQNVCVIYDLGRANNVNFLVTELLEGETLETVIARGPISPDRMIDHGLALGDGLYAAHRRHIIHRDLKASTVLVTPAGVPKILELGVASLSAAPEGDATTATWTAMSPEQLRGETLDGRSDLFSIGLLFYQMLTGQHAFTGTSGEEVDAAVLSQPAPDPRRGRPDIPLALSVVVLRCLEKDRDARPQTAAELVNDLRRVRNPVPVVVPPPPPVVKETRGGNAKWIGIVAGIVIVALAVYVVKQMGIGQSSTWASAPSATATASTAPVSNESLAEALARRRPLDAIAGESDTPLAVARKELEAQKLRSSNAPAMPSPRVLVPPVFDVVPLPSPDRISLAAISSDGKHLVFRRGDSGDVWMRPLPGGEDARVLAPPPDRQIAGLTITPDNGAVDVLVRSIAPKTGLLGSGDVLRVPLPHGAPVKVLGDVWSLEGWSPDKKRVAYVTDEGGASLAVADADGKNMRILSVRKPPATFNTFASKPPFNRPSWSPDGKLIALVGSGGQDIAVVDAGSGAETTFAWSDVPEIGSVLWFDDDRLVVTRTAPEMTHPQVWTLNVWSREFTRVTDDASSYTNLSSTADRATVAATATSTPGGVWMSPAMGESLKQVLPDVEIAPSTASIDNDGRIVYRVGTVLWVVDTPDGTPKLATGITKIAETDPRGAYVKDGNLWIRRGGAAAEALTTFTDSVVSAFAWSPDGKRLVVVRSKPSSQLMLLKLKK